MSGKAHPPELKKFMDKRVHLKINGNRAVEGILRGFDPFMNLVLDETIEEDEVVDIFGNSFKLLLNRDVVDEVAGKFGVPEEERAQLKLDLEEQTRDEIQCCRILLMTCLP